MNVHTCRDVLVQAGSFGEHQFGKVEVIGSEETPAQVDGKTFQVCLLPGTEIDLRLSMRLFCNKPTYAFPWHGDRIPFR